MAIIVKETSKGTDLIISKTRVVWPRLTEPDTKFDPNGRYSVQMVVEGADRDQLEEILKTAQEAAIQEALQKAQEKQPKAKLETLRKGLKIADLPLKELTDQESGEGTGEWVITSSMKASGTSKKTGKAWSRKPPIFDAKLNPVKGGVDIWGGSILTVNSQLSSYNSPAFGVGVSLRLQGVQIHQLSSGGGMDAASLGFGAAEAGFEYGGEGIADSPDEAFGDSGNAGEDDF